ncbi:MAG: hypothetical protein ABI759_22970 [Candidatus Solibacter sp.]
MENFIAWTVMAGVSLPLSYLIARGCLRGLVRLMTLGTSPSTVRTAQRDVL